MRQNFLIILVHHTYLFGSPVDSCKNLHDSANVVNSNYKQYHLEYLLAGMVTKKRKNTPETMNLSIFVQQYTDAATRQGYVEGP